MEFLAIIGPLVAAASKALSSGLFGGKERKRARADIDRYLQDLRVAIADEGRKIQKYLEFDGIVGEINRALSQIVQTERNTRGDDAAFWSIAELTHQQLQNAVGVTLLNFDLSPFEAYHRGQVDTVRPDLQTRFARADALFDVQDRGAYIRCLLEARPQVRRLEGFGTMIIERVGNSLVGFGGS